MHLPRTKPALSPAGPPPTTTVSYTRSPTIRAYCPVRGDQRRRSLDRFAVGLSRQRHALTAASAHGTSFRLVFIVRGLGLDVDLGLGKFSQLPVGRLFLVQGRIEELGGV